MTQSMIQSKSGVTIFFGIQMAVLILICVIILIPVIKDQLSTARAADYLDCDNSSITLPEQGSCILISFFMFAFIGACLTIAMVYIKGKL